ncbi:hypothetical protein BT63DRAFT_442479 [Microthyrium microscopicum]|uniref:Uncharacterized protein n=1 Tax=Microthyrium microscopicum TaxID=703497 RepID=A0A6A6U3E4_9PEZI|nr:hypothetical protein BT63DRAFT_442479 [Microthyrium microscopicum]
MTTIIDGNDASQAAIPPQDVKLLEQKVYESQTLEDEPQGTRQKVKNLGHSAKRTTKKILHIDNTVEQIGHDQHPVSKEIDANAGFNPSQTLDVEAGTLKKLSDKIPKPHSVHELGHIMRHPIDAAQKQAAQTLDASENPHLSREDNDNLIDTHQQLKELEQVDLVDSTTEQRISELHKDLNNMEEEREQKRVAWLSSRYVSGARALRADQYRFPLLSTCRWTELVKQGETKKEEDPPHFDQEVLMQEGERLVITSSPIQSWASDLLKLRDWQNPTMTGLWLATWLGMWYINAVFTFVYLYAAFRVLQTRTPFDQRESLQEITQRADADDETSNTLGELVTRHGSSDWLEPVLDTIGPTAQPMLRSAADWMEILVNYPEAKTNRALGSILAILGVGLLVANFVSTESCLRATELLLILGFFLDKPLARRYPNYRSVLVPMHWILWDVPTNTETGFRYLRQRAQEMQKNGFRDQSEPTRRALIEPSSISIPDLMAAKCKWNKTDGSIVLTANEIYFMRSKPQQEMWRRRYEDIVQMSKGDGRTSLFKQNVHFLEIEFKGADVVKLEPLKKNDEVFNIIFAFSNLQWRQA